LNVDVSENVAQHYIRPSGKHIKRPASLSNPHHSNHLIHSLPSQSSPVIWSPSTSHLISLPHRQSTHASADPAKPTPPLIPPPALIQIPPFHTSLLHNEGEYIPTYRQLDVQPRGSWGVLVWPTAPEDTPRPRV
ncbi:hypothetical protein BD779DRAFT_1784395, partial [Infundibulicybe gibba]